MQEDLTKLCAELHALKKQRKEQDQAVKDTNKDIANIDSQIQGIYIDEGITSQKILGIGTVSMVETQRASMKDPELLYEHLRNLGEDAIIKETIHPQTLSAWYKSKLAEGMTDDALELLGCKGYRQRQIRITK